MTGQPESRETPRKRARRETEARIVEIGNRMLDESGVEGLSLRAVARELGIVSSAIYRYVKTRDDLLTMLIADAFSSIADAVDEELAAERSVGRVGQAMLAWSRTHPNRWALIYGTPQRAYAAPREVTVVPGTRVMVELTRIIAEDSRPGRSTAARGGGATVSGGRGGSAENPAVSQVQAELVGLGIETSPDNAISAISVWVALLGLINSLRFGQFGPGFAGEDVEAAMLAAVLDCWGHLGG